MKKEEQQLIIGVGVLAVAYFGIIRPILTKVGIFKSAEEKASEQQSTVLTAQESAQILKTQKPTKTDFDWRQIADQIYTDLRYSALDDNKSDATYQATRVKNNADVIKLFGFFGKRQEYAFGIPIGAQQNLFEFLKSNLSKSQIFTINDNWKRKNIKYSL